MESIKKIRTVLITGSNKGIGFGIIQGMLKRFDNYHLILTSRNEDLGKESLNKLYEEFPTKKELLAYHQLDITDNKSISEFIDWLKSTYGKIDVLVNNAAVAGKGSTCDIDVFNFTFPTNVDGTITFTEKMIDEDLINSGGKVVIVGSMAGMLNKLKNEETKNLFRDENLTIEKLYKIKEKFKNALNNDKVNEEGFPRACYAVSKMIINSYARVLGQRKEVVERNIGVYALCPGWIRTDMTGHNQMAKPIEDGIQTPIFCITLEDGINKDIQGQFFQNSKLSSIDTD
jgi:NAD(P)-dependent dehydrogenase (short-subunit alcohol dehydrogenase family)